jgi:predicted nucleic acid-binding protein
LPPPPRRVWGSSTIINYLAGKEVAQDCKLIIQQAERGELEIVTSILAEAEVVKLEGELSENAEARIREFFGRDYVIRAALDVPVVELARDLVRRYRGLKPLDAVHIATALHHNIPILETFDEKMIRLVNGKEGDPPLVVRNPLYEGTRPLPFDA